MNQCSISSEQFELDLAFNGASENLLDKLVDSSSRIVLTEAESWENDLRMWIQFIRGDQSLLCPEKVRSTPSVTMGLQFTNDSTITALNSTWRRKLETTDVLSFPVFDETMCIPDSQFVELGDIFISVNKAEQQAKEHNHPLVYELRWLVSHGLLHLLGWDHPTSEKLNEMLRCQEQLLSIDGNLPKRR